MCFCLLQHNLCCDNCHSHVALALNLMHYDNSTSWNMGKLCVLALLHGKHVRYASLSLSVWQVDRLSSLLMCVYRLPAPIESLALRWHSW